LSDFRNPERGAWIDFFRLASTTISGTSSSLWRQDPVGKTVPVACGDWGRCRMHDGAQGSGGPQGARNGNYKHRRYTAEAIASRRWLGDKSREVRALTKMRRLFLAAAGDKV
jgi:hypothetical protein